MKRTLSRLTLTLGAFACGALIAPQVAPAGPEPTRSPAPKAPPKLPDKDVSKTGKAPKSETLGPPSKAVTNEIIDAVAEEMNRAMTQLEIPGAPKPYHIAYKITEVEVNDSAASLGFTTSKRNRHFVNLEARVRVGTPAFDNGNFVVPGADELDAVSAINLPLEATPRIARRAAWLVTDAAYKEALIQLRAKIEARKAGGARIDIPGWTTEKPVVSEDAVLVAPLETVEELEARAKNLSALFRDQAALRESRVAITSYLERRWYLTTEGTSVTDTRRASGIVISAAGQADDGQLLHQYFLRYGHTAKDLPSDDELKAEAKKLVDNIAALQKAPVMDRYSGPVLFEGEGAVGLLRAALAPNLGGTPVPEGLNPQEAKSFGGALTDKVGLRVLAPSLSIVDDPTARDGAGKALIGGYKIDDEGVAAQRVEVIKDGVLKTLLTSRTPSAKGQTSNGHARRLADGGAFHGSATNLFVTGKGALPRKALEQRLVSAAQGEGLKYGVVVRRFDDAAITSAPEFSRRELVAMIKSTDQQLPPPTILAYKIFPNGKEQLVRGVQLAEVPIRAWKDVLGVSKEMTVYNFLAATETQLQLRLTGGTDDGFVPSGGIESGIITPDLLLKEIDLGGSSAGERPAPVLPKPSK
ncbi:MAG TPA: metallopeptidase TldD-related protein [Kofleriaceae bacterium]|jgi:predicted Zn-dependent protease|nr:metallopeptidase TldD-related protein [Kofleriaceae bacterium]